MNVLNVRNNGSRKLRWVFFTTLVFSTIRGGMGHAAAVFYRRLAFLVSLQKELSHSSVMSCVCCRIIYSLLHSAVMCLKGARSHQGCPLSLVALDLALAEGQVTPAH